VGAAADADAAEHALTVQRFEAQEAERRRIARELHDVMGQSLSVIKMRLQLLRKRMVKSGSSPENIALCEAVVGDTDDALQSARRLAVVCIANP
jgi:signal transduction histidine kinase